MPRSRVKEHRTNLDNMESNRGKPDARTVGRASRNHAARMSPEKVAARAAKAEAARQAAQSSVTRLGKSMASQAGKSVMKGVAKGSVVAAPIMVAGELYQAHKGLEDVQERGSKRIGDGIDARIKRQTEKRANETMGPPKRLMNPKNVKEARTGTVSTSSKPANKPAKSKAGPTSKGNANTNIKTSSDSTFDASKSSTVTVPKYKDQGTAVTYGTKPAPVVEKSKPARNAGYDNYERIMSSHGLAQGGPVRQMPQGTSGAAKKQYGVNVTAGPKLNKQYGRRKG